MLRIASVVLSCFVVGGCIDSSNGSGSPTVSYNGSGSATVSYVVASEGLQTGKENQQTHIARNASEYSALMSGTQLLGVTPNPDFNENMLVAAFTTLNSCYSLSVASVTETDMSLVVTLAVGGPAEACPPVVGAGYVFIETRQSAKLVSVIYEKA